MTKRRLFNRTLLDRRLLGFWPHRADIPASHNGFSAQTVATRRGTGPQERCIGTPRAWQPQNDTAELLSRANPSRETVSGRGNKTPTLARLPRPSCQTHSRGTAQAQAAAPDLSARTCFVLTSHCSDRSVQTRAQTSSHAFSEEKFVSGL